MTESWSTKRVESALRALSAGIDGPNRDLARPALAAPSPAARPGQIKRPALVLAAVGILVIILTTAAVAPARRAVAEWLGVGATRVTVGSAQIPPAGASLSDVLGPPLDPLSVDLAVGFRVAEPSERRTGGPPTRHAVRLNGDLGAVLVYEASDRLPAIERSSVGLVLSQREVEGATLVTKTGSVEALDSAAVGDAPALWLGGPHLLEAGPQRLRAANVLLWVADGLEYRLESDLALTEAVAIAETIAR